jgi:hypothetical protein
MKSDYWTDASDPYVVLSVGNQSARSSVVARNIHPQWNEMFFFHLFGTEPHKLSLLVFDHDFLTADDSLGSVEVNLDLIERDKEYRLDLKIENASSGSIRVVIRRAALTSDRLVSNVIDLAKRGKPITEKNMKKVGISLDQFLGKEAFFLASKSGSVSNPALDRLVELIKSKALPLENERTMKKIQTILLSQEVIFTSHRIAKHVWFCGFPPGQQEFFDFLFDISNQTVQKFMFSTDGTACLVSFPSIETAILAVINVDQIRREDVIWFQLGRAESFRMNWHRYA